MVSGGIVCSGIMMPLLDELTAREHEIVQLIGDGYSNREIARDLSLSYETVKWYSKRIYRKLQINNRTELILLFQKEQNLKNTASTPTQLPQVLTKFLGRQREINDLKQLLHSERLITLVGNGGIGKTRLAIEVAQAQDAFQQVLYLSLHSVDSEDQLITTLCNAFGIMLSDMEQALNRLLSALPVHQCLLILDNFETVLNSANILPRMLQQAEHMTILVTSRSVLHLQSESIYVLDGLPLDKSEAAEQSAIDLFCERANRQQAQFDAHDLTTIGEICQLLDGSPLAIELAASWINALTCEQILSELQQGIDILSGDLLDMDARHQSMQVVCEQSWQMLTQNEQKVFMHLSVFRGGFSTEASFSVGGASIQNLNALVNKSILRLTHDGRYHIHDVLRLFAQERLEQNTTDATAVRDAHANFFIQFLADIEIKLRQPEQAHYLQLIDLELDNILDAWRWLAEQGSVSPLEAALLPLARFLSIRDRSKQGADLFADTLNYATEEDVTFAGLLLFRGWFEVWLGNTDTGARHMFRALDVLDNLDASDKWAMPMCHLSFNEGFDEETKQTLFNYYEHHLTLYETRNDQWSAAWMLYSLGNITRANEQLEASEQYLLKSLAYFQSHGDFYGQAWAVDALSTTYRRMKRYKAAVQMGEQLLAISEILSYGVAYIIAYEVFGDVTFAQEDYRTAYTRYRQALQYALKNADPTTIIPILLSLAKTIVEEGSLPQHIPVEMFAIVQSHTSSQHGWFDFRQQEAQSWLNTLQDNRIDGYYTAILRGQSTNLITSTRRLLQNALPEQLSD